MATCFLVLSGGGQHKVMDSREAVERHVKQAKQSGLPLRDLPGQEGATFYPEGIVAVREDDAA